jgi:hypothetical protein
MYCVQLIDTHSETRDKKVKKLKNIKNINKQPGDGEHEYDRKQI